MNDTDEMIYVPMPGVIWFRMQADDGMLEGPVTQCRVGIPRRECTPDQIFYAERSSLPNPEEIEGISHIP